MTNILQSQDIFYQLANWLRENEDSILFFDSDFFNVIWRKVYQNGNGELTTNHSGSRTSYLYSIDHLIRISWEELDNGNYYLLQMLQYEDLHFVMNTNSDKSAIIVKTTSDFEIIELPIERILDNEDMCSGLTLAASIAKAPI